MWKVRLECGCTKLVERKPVNSDSVYCDKPNHSSAHAVNWTKIFGRQRDL